MTGVRTACCRGTREGDLGGGHCTTSSSVILNQSYNLGDLVLLEKMVVCFTTHSQKRLNIPDTKSKQAEPQSRH